jgi:hypothetical protein
MKVHIYISTITVQHTIKYNKRTIYIDYIVCIFIYILHQSEKLKKSIGILFHLVETDIGGKGKGLLLVETCYALLNSF